MGGQLFGEGFIGLLKRGEIDVVTCPQFVDLNPYYGYLFDCLAQALNLELAPIMRDYRR